MAFLKTAAAPVEQKSVERDDWNSIRKRADIGGSFSRRSANDGVDLNEYSPDDYLLSHCTIIASVDTEEPPNVKTGDSIYEGGREITRPYSDYYIDPDTDQYINQNSDSWERNLLLQTYDTFIGAENYVEHVQIPEKSKGKVIDAVARDLGDTIYVDILVATNRKHEDLVESIESGDLDTLSMGCFPAGTPVTLASGASKPIDDIEIGDEVYTHEGEAKEVTSVQQRMWHRDLVEIETPASNDPLRATDNHPFLAVRPQEECACGCGEEVHFRESDDAKKRLRSRFKQGHDKRILNGNADYDEDERDRREKLEEIREIETEWVEAGDLKENDWLVFPESDVTSSPDDVSESDARLMGYYLAEGNILRDELGDLQSVEFTFGLHERDTIVREVSRILDKKEIDYSIYDREDKSTSVVRAHDRSLAAFLHDNCSHYADEKEINRDDLLLWPSYLKKSLIGAYLNGDGYVTEQGGVKASTVSYQLHQQIRRMLGTLGIRTSEWCKTEHEGKATLHQASEIGRQENNRLPVYELNISKSQRHHLQEFTKWETPSDVRSLSQDNVEGMVLVPVREISRVPCEEDVVYDFEVEEDHSYVVDGYAVHNCTISYSLCSKCGNLAADETDLCHHVRHQKGQTFVDENGVERKIAEICGHREDPESVKFIEASWVASPAFDGAVMRKILGEDEINENPSVEQSIAEKLDQAHSIDLNQLGNATASGVSGMDNFLKSARKKGASADQIKEAVAEGVREGLKESDFNHRFHESQTNKYGQGFGGGGGGDEGEGDEELDLSDLSEEVKDLVGEMVVEDFEEMAKDEDKEWSWETNPMDQSTHDTVIHSTMIQSYDAFKSRYSSMIGDKDRERSVFLALWNASQNGWDSLRESSSVSNKDIVGALYIKESDFSGGNPVSPELYRCLVRVGGTSNYDNKEAFLRTCSLALGRELTDQEKKELIKRGKLLK